MKSNRTLGAVERRVFDLLHEGEYTIQQLVLITDLTEWHIRVAANILMYKNLVIMEGDKLRLHLTALNPEEA
jgi:hypothetical protein